MTKTITIGEISYRIYTQKEDGFHYGCWTNLTTGSTGGSSKRCDSEQEALEAGEHNARMDYAFKHNPSA